MSIISFDYNIVYNILRIMEKGITYRDDSPVDGGEKKIDSLSTLSIPIWKQEIFIITPSQGRGMISSYRIRKYSCVWKK